jgi:hypothetical protein
MAVPHGRKKNPRERKPERKKTQEKEKPKTHPLRNTKAQRVGHPEGNTRRN